VTRALITGITGQDALALAGVELHRGDLRDPQTLRDSGARVLQASSSEIFAPASGAPSGARRQHEVAGLVARTAFAHVGLDWREHVVLRRPADSVQQVGDASKAARELGWTPRIGFDALVAMMVDADLERLGG
jgi:nucleoside-diphosphate-sugar epimerase